MRRRSATRGRIALLAGWLFADLLAVLFVIELSTEQGHAAAPTRPTISHSASPGPSKSPSPGPGGGHPFGLDPKFLMVHVTNLDYGLLAQQGPDGSVGRDIVNQVTQQIHAVPGGNRPVGFVVTLADAPQNDAGIAIANSTAVLVDKVLFAHQPQFAACRDETGWQGAHSEGTIMLKVFFDNT